MGNFFSEAAPARPPSGVRKISESLYELYRPDSEPPKVDIIFFHGLQPMSYADAYWKTWSSGGNQLWPRTWLGEDFPQARILSVSYDSCAAKSARGGLLDMFQIGENLVTIILGDNGLHVGQNRPVILVGHSLGGLVIKQFLLTADKLRDTNPEFDNFLDKSVAGVFYYATPHTGSILADTYAKKVYLLRFLLGMSPLMGFLRTLNNEAARLNQHFRTLREKCGFRAYAVAESHRIQFWFFSVLVVEEASSRLDVDQGSYYTAPKDHVNICKPEDKFEATYKLLRNFITDSVKQKADLDLAPTQDLT